MRLARQSTGSSAQTGRRRTVRLGAAAASALVAVLSALIGIGVVSVVTESSADAPPLIIFGLSAGAAFALGAILLVALDRRILWILGALFQVGVIVMYINVAPHRTPPFEMWGITIKILQVLILGALAYLVITPSEAEARPR
jgi:hypothetical protein